MRTPAAQLLFTLVAGLLLSGCLTSPNAFYNAEDVFQDDRIVGDYQEPKAEDGFVIRKDPEQKGRYILRDYEGTKTARWVELTATLFKVGTNTYIDLFPDKDFSMNHIAGVPPGGVDIIRNLTHQPLHVIARIAITDDGLAFSLPEKRKLWELVQRHPIFKGYIRDESVLVLPLSSTELRKLLEQEGESVFPKPADFKKPKPLPH